MTSTTQVLVRMGSWVQYHELINGQTQIFTTSKKSGIGNQGGRLIPLAVEGDEVTAYPTTSIDIAPSAPPSAKYGYLLQPAGDHLIVAEAHSASRRQELTIAYQFRTRGIINQRPVWLEIQGTPAVLLCDSTGTLLAIDPDPNTPSNSRTIMSWPLGGRATAAPLVDTIHQQIVTVLGEDGVIVGVPLPGHSRSAWRFPADGRLSSLVGQAALGKNGIYLADQNGIMYCIDFNGKERWRVDLGSSPTTGILAVDGKLFIGTRSSELLCFEEGVP